MLSSPSVHHHPQSPLPSSVDVVIIGGGIIGVCAAYYLAQRKVSVLLVEKGRIAAEQSSRNWGWVRQQGRDEVEIPLAREGLNLWGKLQENGRELGFRTSGILWATDKLEELAGWEKWATKAVDFGVHSQILRKSDVDARMPGSAKNWVGGMLTSTDGRAEPSLATQGIAQYARDAGVLLLENCAARGVETSNGRISGVVTELGSVRTSSVIVAGGVWSSMFCRQHGIDFPQAAVNATVFRTAGNLAIPTGAVGTPTVCIRQRLDGSVTVAYKGKGTLDMTPDSLRYARKFWPMFLARRKDLKIKVGRTFLSGLANRNWTLDKMTPFEKVRILNPAPEQSLIDAAKAELQKIFPEAAGAAVAEAWGGAIDWTPDSLPIMSPIEKLPGLYLASGFSGHGFGVGPSAGHLIADIVTGDKSIVDPQPYRYGRLFENASYGMRGAL